MGVGAKGIMILGSMGMGLAVLLGAFGAHALKAKLTADMLNVYHTANQYHFYHALGLLLIGVLSIQWPQSAWLYRAAWCMGIGIFCFSGSLYILSTTSQHWLGPVTPLGGLLLIISWIFLIIALIQLPHSSL